MLTIKQLIPVNEDGHMATQTALIVEHLAASLFVNIEIAVEHVAEGRSGDVGGGAGDVPLDIAGESDGGHQQVF